MQPAGAIVLDAMLTRRSTQPLGEPGPTEAELEVLLRAATTVPDHGGLRPWRLVVVAGDARAEFGAALADAACAAAPHLSPAMLERVAAKAFAAPTLIALVAAIDPVSKVPAWEQVASASCVGYALALAAHAMGMGAMWKSTPFTDGARLRQILSMADDDQFLGWVNLGRQQESRRDTPRPPGCIADVARVLQDDGTSIAFTGPSNRNQSPGG